MKPEEEKKEAVEVIVGCYNEAMTDLLGYDVIKNVYDASVLAVEDELRCSEEVRTKGLQTAGLLGALVVGLMTALCAIHSLFAQIIIATIALVLTKTLYGIFKGVIYRKENVKRGNTHSNMLNKQMIDRLQRMTAEKRAAFVLASNLKRLEKDADRQKTQTEEMQQCFEHETKLMIWAVTVILALTLIVTFLIQTATPVS